MKKILLATTLAAFAAAPALATPHKQAARDYVASNTVYAYAAPQPGDVMSEGQVIGRDPDPSVRAQLRREGTPSNQGAN